MAFTIDTLLNPFKSIPGISAHMMLEQYQARYEEIKSRILWGLAVDKGHYIAHVRIPSSSELCPDIFYDVVLELYPASEKVAESRSLNEYSVKIYSNCPSFIYQFTYAYNRYNLIADFLKNKCSKICLTKPAVRLNPNNAIGVDIDTWQAAFHLKRLGLLSYKQTFEAAAKATRKKIYDNVFTQEAMLVLRSRSESKEREKRKIQKAMARANKHNSDYQEQKSYEHAVAKASGGKLNSRVVGKKIAKAARTARSPRHPRRPR